MAEHPKLLGMGDVMIRLGVSRQYIDRLVVSGKLKCQITSTGKVFFEEDVLQFKKTREKKRAEKRKLHS